jgi:glycosyltransferase involved in cell wall biosynthesis
VGIRTKTYNIEEKLVSIIMNCWNGEKYLSEALDSVVAQTYSNWEIVFWDNASTDKSCDIALSYGKKVRYFRSEGKLSLGEARNQAFSEARGEFIAILDVDDIWLPDKLERQLDLFKDPDIAMTFTNAISFDSKGEYYKAFKRTPTKRKMIFADLLRHNFIWTVTMMFRHSVLDKMDYLFDPEFRIVCDYDLTLRLAYRYKTDHLDKCLAKWRMYSRDGSNSKSFLSARESIRLLDKLEKVIPELRHEFSDEVRVLEMLSFRKLAQEAWLNGDKEKVRFLLKKYWRQDTLSFLAYVGAWIIPSRCSEVSIKLVQFIRKRLGHC